ncbi:MAG: hypothetical protein AB7V04_09800 [Desulfomonilaceae bacterium]
MNFSENMLAAITGMIRESSQAGLIIPREDLFEALSKVIIQKTDCYTISFFEKALDQILEENADINRLTAKNGVSYYYSSLSMSDTYARILAGKQDDTLIADIVRENSQLYPRPVPLSLFEHSPFGFTREQILDRLKLMSVSGGFQDIVQTTTSSGNIFLYSSRFLDHDYAIKIAEWLDIGEANNP